MHIPNEVVDSVNKASKEQERRDRDNARKREKRAAEKLAKQASEVQEVKPVVVDEVPTHSADTGGLIPQGVANKMAQDAVQQTPAPAKGFSTKEEAEAIVQVAAPVEAAVVAAAAQQPDLVERAGLVGFNQLDICLMITLNLSDSRFINGQTKSLVKVKDVDGNIHNLYWPFRKAKEEKGIAAGVFRPLFNKMFKTIDMVKSNQLLVVGDRAGATEVFKKALNTIQSDIEGMFPKFDQAALNEVGATVGVNDVFVTTSWVNTESASTESLSFNQAVINFQVNCGQFYDTEDRAKFVRDLEGTLKMYAEKYPNASVLYGVTIAMEDLEDQDIRDLTGILLDEDGFTLFTKSKMVRSLSSPDDKQDWIPHSKEGIETLLMPTTADALFVKVVASEDESTEADEE